MKHLLLSFLLVVCGCSQLASTQRALDGPADIKARVMKLVAERRANEKWMKPGICPSEYVPRETRMPKLAANECASDPGKCMKQCDSEDADSCFALAQMIQQHDTIENDVADVLYRTSCRLGIPSGCTNAAGNLFETNEQASLICAASTFELSCGAGDAWACTMFGFAALEGIGRKKSESDAVRYFERACEVAVEKNGAPCTRAKELKALMVPKS